MIYTAKEEEYPILIEIWESAVLATHDFLKKEDFEYYKANLQVYFKHVSLYVYKSNPDSQPKGFLGVSADNIEMLFIDNQQRGTGIGKQLLSYATDKLKIRKVDVNEQNIQALEFYLHQGFVIRKRSKKDSEDKEYPILHLYYLSPDK